MGVILNESCDKLVSKYNFHIIQRSHQKALKPMGIKILIWCTISCVWVLYEYFSQIYNKRHIILTQKEFFWSDQNLMSNIGNTACNP